MTRVSHRQESPGTALLVTTLHAVIFSFVQPQMRTTEALHHQESKEFVDGTYLDLQPCTLKCTVHVTI